MRLRIDEDLCTGHLRCYDQYPELFDVDDLGHGLVISPDVAPDAEATARDAVFGCPERAITVEG